MAKKKKKAVKRRSTRRRSSIGAADFSSSLYAALGGIASELIDKVAGTALDPKIVQGGKVVLGVVAPMMFKDAKTKQLVQGIGNGLVAVGVVNLAKEFGMLSGTADNPDEVEDLAVVLEGDEISADVLGEGDLDVINADVLGEGDLDVVNGYQDMLM